jgi:hypothetical protein
MYLTQEYHNRQCRKRPRHVKSTSGKFIRILIYIKYRSVCVCLCVQVYTRLSAAQALIIKRYFEIYILLGCTVV